MEDIFANFGEPASVHTAGKEPLHFLTLEEAGRWFLELPVDIKLKSHIAMASGQIYLPDEIPRLRRRLGGEGTK